MTEQERTADLIRSTGRIEGRLTAIENSISLMRQEVREDMDRGRQRMDKHDERIREIPDNRDRIDLLEKRVSDLEEQGTDTKDILLRWVLPLSGAGGAGAGITSLLGG